MTQLSPYLRFNGNCREAMNFYKDCLGGELTMQAVGDTSMQNEMAAELREHIVHASLVHDGMTLLGSDMVGPAGLTQGNTVALALTCSSEAAIQTNFANLAAGGHINQPLEVAFWGGIFGSLVDKFGNEWMLTYEKPQA